MRLARYLLEITVLASAASVALAWVVLLGTV